MNMKRLTFFVLLTVFGLAAMAQEPVSDSVVATHRIESAVQSTDTLVTILAPADLVLRYNEENVVQLLVKEVNPNNLMVTAVDRDACSVRSGGAAGKYLVKPLIREGFVVLRIGKMDMLGSYQKIKEISFTVLPPDAEN